MSGLAAKMPDNYSLLYICNKKNHKGKVIYNGFRPKVTFIDLAMMSCRSSPEGRLVIFIVA